MIVAIYHGPDDRQWPRVGAFAEGLVRHGLAPLILSARHEPVDCDLAVTWAHKRHDVYARQRDAGRDYLVLELGFLGDRSVYTSAGYNGLNGRADFVLEDDMPGDRLEPHRRLLVTPRPGGEYALLIGQVRGDAATVGVDLPRWYEAMRANLERLGVPCLFRPHPLTREGKRNPAPLAEQLARAFVVVTLNSTAGVEAACAGVPVIAIDEGSMVWPIAGHSVELAATPPLPTYEVRQRWARRLAWCQWTVDEMARGEAWAHLARRSATPVTPGKDGSQ